MPYLLDSNVWVAILRGRDKVLSQRVKGTVPNDVCLCSVVKAELVYGAHRSTDPKKNITLVEALVAAHRSFPFDDAAAESYGEIRAALESKGKTIGANDYFIASIAVANNLTLVTHNTSEFSRVRGLKLEDWQAP